LILRQPPIGGKRACAIIAVRWCMNLFLQEAPELKEKSDVLISQ
jgi:hypothetical protein